MLKNFWPQIFANNAAASASRSLTQLHDRLLLKPVSSFVSLITQEIISLLVQAVKPVRTDIEVAFKDDRLAGL